MKVTISDLKKYLDSKQVIYILNSMKDPRIWCVYYAENSLTKLTHEGYLTAGEFQVRPGKTVVLSVP